MGLDVKLLEGTSGLGGGGRGAVSCRRAVPSPVVSPRVAVVEALAPSGSVLRGESGKSRRRGAAVALRGVRAWRRGDPGQEGKGRLLHSRRCLAAAGSAPGAGFLLTTAHEGHCNPPERCSFLQQEKSLVRAAFG